MKLWISLSAVALITTEELWPLNLRDHVFDNVTFTNWLDYRCSMASHDFHNNTSYFNITTTSLKKYVYYIPTWFQKYIKFSTNCPPRSLIDYSTPSFTLIKYNNKYCSSILIPKIIYYLNNSVAIMKCQKYILSATTGYIPWHICKNNETTYLS